MTPYALMEPELDTRPLLPDWTAEEWAAHIASCRAVADDWTRYYEPDAVAARHAAYAAQAQREGDERRARGEREDAAARENALAVEMAWDAMVEEFGL